LIGRELVEQLLESDRYDAVWIVVRRSKRWNHPKPLCFGADSPFSSDLGEKGFSFGENLVT